MSKKVIKVAGAVICNSLRNKNAVLATVRGYGDYKGYWEFPGGKLEKGETSEQALIREIREELNVTIVVDKLIKTIEYDYPNFHLSMDCYWCEIVGGNFKLVEALDYKWVTKNDLYSLKWMPADVGLLDMINETLN